MPTQVTQFAGSGAGASPFVAINIATFLLGAGYTGSTGLTELTIINGSTVAGNLVLSSSSSIVAEATGIPISDAITMRAAGNPASDRIQATELYLFSATALKDFSIYVRAIP